jgi:pimeloyl-ACP methyl ester carboxylesterase
VNARSDWRGIDRSANFAPQCLPELVGIRSDPDSGLEPRLTTNRIVRVVLAASTFLVCGQALVAQTNTGIAWEPYVLRTYSGQSHNLQLGRLRVPESRARASGASVTVAFLHLASTSPTPGSPIVFLMGGPGVPASIMAPIPPYWALFDSLRSVADVILLDQRGLGLSAPKLDCPPAPERPDSALLTSQAAFVTAYGKVIANCAAHFRAQGVDPLAYSDAAIADDVDDIRSALGVARVSLLGFSYGSRIAMSFVRRHPEHVDRVVLQGPTDEQTMYRSSLAFDSLFARVARAADADSTTVLVRRDALQVSSPAASLTRGFRH